MKEISFIVIHKTNTIKFDSDIIKNIEYTEYLSENNSTSKEPIEYIINSLNILQKISENAKENYIGVNQVNRFISFGKKMNEDAYSNVYIENVPNNFIDILGYNNKKQIEDILKPIDLIITNPWLLKNSNIISVKQYYSHLPHGEVIVSKLKKILSTKTEDLDSLNYYLNNDQLQLYPIFLMKKEIIQEYLTWIIPIINSVATDQEIIKISSEGNDSFTSV